MKGCEPIWRGLPNAFPPQPESIAQVSEFPKDMSESIALPPPGKQLRKEAE